MATPSFFHGIGALAEKIQSHQLQHADDSIDAATAVKVASRRLNSTFQSTLGRRKKDPAPPDPSDGRRRSSHSAAVTPAPSTNTPPSSSAGLSPVPFNLIGDVVPNHAPRPNSTTAMPYTPLLPSQLARLSPRDELIVVVQCCSVLLKSRSTLELANILPKKQFLYLATSFV
jgi:hypothetical protein